MWLGSALLGLERIDEAMAAYREAVRLEPDNGQAYQGLARALWVGKGDFAAAIPVFERAIRLNPDAGYSYLQLALLLTWERRSIGPRRSAAVPSISRNSSSRATCGLQIVGAHSRLGYVHYLQGRYADAHPGVRARAWCSSDPAITRSRSAR